MEDCGYDLNDPKHPDYVGTFELVDAYPTKKEKEKDVDETHGSDNRRSRGTGKESNSE